MNCSLKTLEFEKILNHLSQYAKTEYAKEKIQQLEPSNNIVEVNKLLNETKEAYNAIVKYQDIPLGGLFEVKNSLLRCKIGSMLHENELLNVVGLIDATNNVIKYFNLLDNLKLNCTNLHEYSSKLIYLQLLKSNIQLCISDDGKVCDNASKDLFNIRRNLQSANNRLRGKLNELLVTHSKELNEQLIVSRNNRMCLPVKSEYKYTFKGIIQDESASHTTVYIEPQACVEISSQIESLINKEKIEIENILKSLSLLVSADSDTLLQNLELLTDLDIIFSKAQLAIKENYYLPKINDSGIIELKMARHPLIDKNNVVPIDIEIGKKFNTIIITGPNTGGKTVTLKTCGLLTIMTQTGLFIPAKEDSNVAVFDDVFVDIGDEQSIEQSLSTFSSHMTKIKYIIDNVSYKSLVLLDELGSGTDPKEGSALAISIIDYLKARDARIIATTHYSDLKNYAYNCDDISNASVEFNSETLRPTYRLLMGIPGKSNAIDIAKKLGINEKIINDSKNRLSTDSTESQELLSKLDNEISDLRNKEDELNHIINEYNRKIQDLDSKKSELQNKTDSILNEATKKANLIIQKAKEDSESLIKELDALRKNNEYQDNKLASIKYKARNLKTEDETEDIFNEELKEGDAVYIKSYNQIGIIQKIKKDKYVVSFGQFQMDFDKSALKKTEKPSKKEVKKTALSGYNISSHADLSLDLRGKRYEEVSYLLDSFLDQAYLGNLNEVTIIHGFGTGTIRNAVQQYLKNCPYIKSYRYGKEGEGLNGVTIVYLK